MSFAHALKWSMLTELVAKTIQPALFIALASLLSPGDFGVMTAALMVIAFSQIFWEAGMGQALIQRQTDLEAAADATFLINILLGIVIAGMLYLLAHPIALSFFQDERVATVLRVLTIQVLLGPFSSVQTALLKREMQFKKLFWVRFATVALPGIASIPFAVYGWGYWALVAGALTGQFAQIVMLWRISSWRPRLVFDFSVTREMTKFGAWVSLTGLLGWFFLWVDSLIVAKYFGVNDLGLYKVGSQLAVMLFSMVFGPILPVLYSYYSRSQGRARLTAVEVEKMTRAVMWVSVPVAVFVFSYSHEIESIFFYTKWSGIGFIIGWLSLREGLGWITGLNGELYRALGKPQYETIVLVVSVAFYLPSYLYLANIGLDYFVVGRFLLVVVSLGLHLLLLRFVMHVSLKRVIVHLVLFIVVSFVVVGVLKGLAVILFDSAVFQLVLGTVLFVAVWMALFVTVEKNQIGKEIFDAINRELLFRDVK